MYKLWNSQEGFMLLVPGWIWNLYVFSTS
jgi:hypothetical protein